MKKIITFGTYDLLHEGHLNILKRAKAQGDYLIVGVSSDQLNDRKGKISVFSEKQRLAYVADLRYVDEVFLEESLELKDDYIKKYGADLLVMGDDWVGRFDWVDCDVTYLPRTEGVSSTLIKSEIKQLNRMGKVVFGDTYLDKHMDCALTIVNQLTSRNVAPIFTKENALPRKIDTDILVYFNKPINAPFPEYENNSRVLIDHGASHLKWFLGSRERMDFFDVILTAGPDHVRALQAIFDGTLSLRKVRAVGFIKSEDLLAEPKMTRDEVCQLANLNPDAPIVFFAPTWHISANDDIIRAIEEVQKIDNHVASFHPETAHLPVGNLNKVQNINGITTELMKHADVVISDLSSTIYEAAAIGKPIVQLLLKEYPDNTGVLYDLPLSAGTAEHFCGGIQTRPQDLIETVALVLRDEPGIAEMMDACRERILAGTFISQDATDNIAEQIKLLCEQKRTPPAVDVVDKAQLPKTPRYNRNLFFARNRLIGHGGGNFEGHHASNSVEATNAAIATANIVELDICLGKDGLIVAVDGFEPKYCLETNFAETTTAEFMTKRFNNVLTPISIEDALRKCTQNGKALVCDIKPTGTAYNEVASALREAVAKHGQIEQTVVQCYSVDDFTEALRLGFQRMMLPAWKYFYRNPIGTEVFDFYSRCIEINADAVWGLSLPFTNKHLDGPIVDHRDFRRMYAYWKRIFIHGAPMHEYPRLLNMNLGLFADALTPRVEFKDVPKGFDWRRYLFLNPGLITAGKDNEVKAVEHYIQYGEKEGRAIAYDLPKGFSYGTYIAKNPKLRKLSVNGHDTAASHYTRIGAGAALEF